MDRDNRWERVSEAYGAMICGDGQFRTESSTSAINNAYNRSETDEFIQATVLGDYAGVQDGDGVWCLNFRADRAREILAANGQPGFDAFDTGPRPKLAALMGMVEYSDRHNDYMTTVFPARDIVNTLGAWVAKQGLKQFRLAETEKYPHVTFFLNGGKEVPEAGEDRYMASSPKVATYDLQPEMSAGEVTDHFVQAVESGEYDLIITNYANPDMVGHTGDLQAAITACEAVDTGLARVMEALEKTGGAMIVTADHGNCETMVDPDTGGPHTAHTTNPVPVALFGGPDGAALKFRPSVRFSADAAGIDGPGSAARNDRKEPSGMTLRTVLLCAFLTVVTLATEIAAQSVDPAEGARAAAQRLDRATAALDQAKSARDRVKALSETIRAFEDGLAAMRQGLRRASIREQTLTRELATPVKKKSRAFLACCSRQAIGADRPRFCIPLAPQEPPAPV